ncbi:hypothetical protein I6J77_02070 [Rhodanobacter sp. FDAARGOS 1247]|uniref:hypothetical protein n=1 Tax=Rhodanobacter sp. FDAARGOS 1247 TaxID=2778082 RepID=UPI001950A64F|nr:hypothetical protein [Rhodanobacter sp. FDAARGOS 1247]QRP64274.1 hypothetical protein I6J77_02070 [Rhodanobacter sp. FDAARGOS 1247]
MKYLLSGLLLLSAPAFAADDPCAQAIPPALRQALQQHFPDERLPSLADISSADRRQIMQRGGTCLLVASTDVDGDQRADVMLILPSRKRHGYRLVAALNSPTGWELESLYEWEGAYDHMYVDVAPPGNYRQTEAYEFIPEPGAVEQLATKFPGFFAGEIESAADAYFLDKGHWVHVHSID